MMLWYFLQMILAFRVWRPLTILVIRRPMNPYWASLLERTRFFLRQAHLSLQQKAESQKTQ